MLYDINGEITPERMKRLSQSKNNTQLLAVAGDGSKVRSCKEQYCIGIWDVRPISSVQFSCSVVSDSWRLLIYSMSGLLVHHQLPEFTQTHIHQVRDAIQPSHPLLCPSPPAANPFQHQSLFQGVNSLHEVAKVLEFQL